MDSIENLPTCTPQENLLVIGGGCRWLHVQVVAANGSTPRTPEHLF